MSIDSLSQSIKDIHNLIPKNSAKNILTSFSVAFLGGICLTINPVTSIGIGILAASISLINFFANNLLKQRGYSSLTITQASLKNTVIILSSFALCSLSFPSLYTIISTFALNLIVNSFIHAMGTDKISIMEDKAIFFLGYTFFPMSI